MTYTIALASRKLTYRGRRANKFMTVKFDKFDIETLTSLITTLSEHATDDFAIVIYPEGIKCPAPPTYRKQEEGQ